MRPGDVGRGLRQSRVRVAATAIIVGLLVVGAVALGLALRPQAEPGGGMRPTPTSIASAATPTPVSVSQAADSPASTWTPSLRPTPKPSPGTTVAPAAFAERMSAGATTVRELADKIDDALVADAFEAIGVLGGQLRAWAVDEVAWLGSHPPTACYADAHASAGEAYEVVEVLALSIADAAGTADGETVSDALVDTAPQATAIDAAASMAASC